MLTPNPNSIRISDGNRQADSVGSESQGQLQISAPTRRGSVKPTKIVRLVYFDEAGIGSLADEPITVVAAVIIHGDDEWSVVEGHIDSIINDLVPADSRKNFEFHAKELLHGSKRCDWGRQKRWEVLTEFLKTFEKYQLPIIWAAADRTKTMAEFALIKEASQLGDPVLPHLLAFTLCQAFVEIWFRSNAANEKGICIADPVTGKMTKALLEGFHNHWRKNRIVPDMDFRNEHLIEAVSFVESHKSIGVQLSDACNLFVKRHLSGMTNSDSERFYGIIKPYIRNLSAYVYPSSTM
jgi:hypothetical protein